MGDDHDRIPARHYAFLGFLTVLNVLNFVDRQLLASFANFIVPDLGLTNAQFGLLTGFAFLIFYATMGVLTGALADLVHRPRLIAAGLAIWSALTAASGAARGFVSLAIPRALIGVGESALTPTSMSLLADRFPARRLGFAAAVYYLGVPIGVGASLLVAGYLGPVIGWRGSFYALGAVGLVFSVVLLFVRETPRAHQAVAVGRAGDRFGLRSIAITFWRAVRLSPALRYTLAGGVALHFILGAAAFDQLWYVRERGFDRAFIAQATGWIGMTGGILGNLVGGIMGDWWLKRTGQGRPMLLVVLGLLIAPFTIAYRVVPPDSVFFWLGIFLGFFKLGTFYGPTFSTVQELVPPRIRATVVACYILLLNLVGLGFGITAGGFVIDRLIAAGVAEPYTKTLLGFTVFSLTAIPFFYLAGRHFERDRARLREMEAA